VIDSTASSRRAAATEPSANAGVPGAGSESIPVQQWLSALSAALASGDRQSLEKLFLEDGYWRDHLALTWDYRTFGGSAQVGAALTAATHSRQMQSLRAEDGACKIFEHRTRGATAESAFRFETDIAECRGHVRLIRDSETGQWRAWTFFTSLEELRGFEEHAGVRRPRLDKVHGPAVVPQAKTAKRAEVLVVGAGHAGLTIAARLGALNVSTLVIDREKRVGDNWRNRYQSLILHNQTAANHLPYLPFPATWPNYLSKEHMADWLGIYVDALGINVMTSTTLSRAEYSEGSRRWSVILRQADGSEKHIEPRHIVQATGVFGKERRPVIDGADRFTGKLMYAADYSGGLASAGERVLVVGTGSSGHDVAQDLCNAGAQVTMLQRSSTCVVSVEPGAARLYALYADDGAPIQDADLSGNSFPFPVVTELHKEMTKRIAEADRELLDGLRAAGFALDFGEDNSGFLMKYHRYGGGYYINVGCSELIVEGKIQIKQGVQIHRLEGRTVHFSDGTSMQVDAVVIAAGYSNMSESVRSLLGDEVAARVGPIWGLDAEGEVRAMWRRTGQPGFWLMGGSLQQCRPYSKYLALQIKASEVGLL
jgi:putative flavoprotein involved in K+ transport